MSMPTVTYTIGGGMTVTRPLWFLSQQTLITPAAADLLNATGFDARELVQRHQAGDWGIVNKEDEAVNNRGLKTGSMLVSTFHLVGWKQLAKASVEQRKQFPVILVITDAALDRKKPLKRHITTVLTREDY